MSYKPTPGPWLLEGTGVYYLDWDGVSYEGCGKDHRQMLTNRFWCSVQGQEKRIPREELLANARLIAAAPDLLAALEALQDDRRLVLGTTHRKRVAVALHLAQHGAA